MSEYQPIASAPKDGTPILAFNSRHPSHAPVVVCWVTDDPFAEEPYWGDAASQKHDCLFFNGNYFDLWMPLPEPPRGDAGVSP